MQVFIKILMSIQLNSNHLFSIANLQIQLNMCVFFSLKVITWFKLQHLQKCQNKYVVDWLMELNKWTLYQQGCVQMLQTPYWRYHIQYNVNTKYERKKHNCLLKLKYFLEKRKEKTNYKIKQKNSLLWKIVNYNLLFREEKQKRILNDWVDVNFMTHSSKLLKCNKNKM